VTDEMLASDRDREQVAEALRDATAEGRLSVDELSERLDQAYGARTRAELDRAVIGLPTRPAPTGDEGYPVWAVVGAVAVTVLVPVGSLIAFVSGLVLLRTEQVPDRRLQLKLWVAGAVVWQAVSLAIALIFLR
jgi:Domain of unknown function (DUF1707)